MRICNLARPKRYSSDTILASCPTNKTRSMSNATPIRTALVTGSTDSNAIGFTAAFLLASQHDFHVIVSGRRSEAATEAAAKLNEMLGVKGTEKKVRG